MQISDYACVLHMPPLLCLIPDAPKLTPDPDRLGQAIGYQRTLICHADANPVPSVNPESNQLYWSFNSIRIQEDERYEKESNQLMIAVSTSLWFVPDESFESWKGRTAD